MSTMKPLEIKFSIDPMSFEPKEEVIIRKLSQMRDAFEDQQAVDAILDKVDPKIVEVFMASIPKEDGNLMVNINTVYPGSVGREYFMTKGHIHADPFHNPEIYVTLKGDGKLMLQTLEGEIFVGNLQPGSISYIPSNWAHRCINIGEEPLVYLGVFPAVTERDYSFGQEEKSFHKKFVQEEGKAQLVDV